MLFYSNMFGLTFVLLLWCKAPCAASNDFTRKVDLSHNPGCHIEECNNNTSVNLIYARAQGPCDTLHYILSTVGSSSPTLLLLRTDYVNATLSVNWTSFVRNLPGDMSGSVTLVSEEQKPVKSNIESVIILNRVLQYNDSMDTAVYNASTQITPHILLSQLKWNVSTSEDSITLSGTNSSSSPSFSSNTTISIIFTPYHHEGQSSVLPSLPYNANSSGWEMNLDSLVSSKSGSSAPHYLDVTCGEFSAISGFDGYRPFCQGSIQTQRFAIESLLLGTQSGICKIKTKSIDDEYAPAAFKTETVKWLSENSSSIVTTKTYQTWRTVGYTSADHSRSTVTDVKTNSLTSLNVTSSQYEDITENHLLMAYFGAKKIKDMGAKSVIFSFGQPEDGYYIASNYTSWSYVVGYGEPVADQFSTLVLCMLFIGMGCPLLVIVFGAIYVTYVRIKRSGNSLKRKLLVSINDYQPIEK